MPHVFLICGDARSDWVWPADLLELGGHMVVIQVGVVTAVAADELERVGVAALRPAINDAGRLAPENQRPTMPRLATGLHACLFR